MNGIDAISEKILADAHEQAAAEIAQAKETAAAIRAEGDAKAQRITDAVQEKSRIRVEAIAKRSGQSGAMERRKELLIERQSQVADVFAQALETLRTLPPDRYRALLVTLVSRAVADGRGGELLLNPQDRAAYGEAVLAAVNRTASVPLTLASDCAPITGGAVIRRGRIEINSALDVLVRMLAEDLAFEVANRLFGKGA